jgi:hypothetical protein
MRAFIRSRLWRTGLAVALLLVLGSALGAGAASAQAPSPPIVTPGAYPQQGVTVSLDLVAARLRVTPDELSSAIDAAIAELGGFGNGGPVGYSGAGPFTAQGCVNRPFTHGAPEHGLSSGPTFIMGPAAGTSAVGPGCPAPSSAPVCTIRSDSFTRPSTGTWTVQPTGGPDCEPVTCSVGSGGAFSGPQTFAGPGAPFGVGAPPFGARPAQGTPAGPYVGGTPGGAAQFGAAFPSGGRGPEIVTCTAPAGVGSGASAPVPPPPPGFGTGNQPSVIQGQVGGGANVAFFGIDGDFFASSNGAFFNAVARHLGRGITGAQVREAFQWGVALT